MMECRMKLREEKHVELGRAAALLGMPEQDLSKISCETGIGRKESQGSEEKTYFTYEELRKICLLSVNRVQ